VISIAELQQFLPAGLHGPEWVGPVVLLFVVAATWNAVRAPSPFRDLRPARLHAIGSLFAIVFGVWIGVSLHPLAGAALLGFGCCLALWSVLLSFGITWRNHIYPGVLPAVLLIAAFLLGLRWPRLVGLFVLVILWGAGIVRRSVRKAADREIKNILSRVLVLTHIESAEYFIGEWFARFGRRASNLQLLTIASSANERVRLYPRARPVSIATDSLALLGALAGSRLDQRLHTDDAGGRTTSWIRVQARDLVNRSIEQSRIPQLLKFLSALMLAIPPARQESWANRALDGGSFVNPAASPPDPEGYIVNIIAELPRFPSGQDLQTVRDQVLRECVKSGPDWLSRLADWAEQWREQTSAQGRDRRIEVVAEVIWGIYEADIGPRPIRYELFDQLRLQLPDLLDGLSIREARLDERYDILLLSVSGMPKRFDELTPASDGGRTGNSIVLEGRDNRRWTLKRLEVAAEDEVLIVFRPDAE
jgi:hypothetical protein